MRVALWVDHQWNAEWADNPARPPTFIPGTNTPEITIPRTAQVRNNRLLIGVGRFRSCLYKGICLLCGL